MRVLVTGGTGFTGTALVKRLAREGHDVVSLDHKRGIKTADLHRLGARVVLGSVTDREAVRSAMAGVDVVFHLAAAFRELSVSDDYYRHVNLDGTGIVLEEARAAGVRRFIYCSTCGVHGNITNPPAAEDAPIAPEDYYQQTKYDAEPMVLDHGGGSMSTVIIRPGAIYGPGDPERFLMIFRRVDRGFFPMFGSGETLYHPLYIDNLIDSFMLVMQAGKGDGRAYLIADDEYLDLNTLVRKVAEALDVRCRIQHFPAWPLVIAGVACERICKPFGVTPPIFPRRVGWFLHNRAFRIDRAKKDLGFQPAVGIDEGLRRTARWYRAEGYLPKRFAETVPTS
jgi:nucleoside-diphosphate-sugar epimerase